MGKAFPPRPSLPAGQKPQVLLLVDRKPDLEQLSGWLAPDYEVAAAEGRELPSRAFDLAILDLPNLKRWVDLVRARKESEHPVWLPFLLLISAPEADLPGPQVLAPIDEVIFTPIRQAELQVRVANLLKGRHLSLVAAGGQANKLLAYHPQAEPSRLAEELALEADLLDLATDAIYVTDLDGNFIYVNEAACQSRGYPKEELLRRNLLELMPPEAIKALPRRFKEMRTKGKISFESAGIHKDGSVVPLEIHARMIDLRGRKVILSVARDITERKQTDEMKARMEAQLGQVQKLEALGTFAGGIAHEFNNVLGAIKGYLELAVMTLKMAPGAEKVKSKLEAALRGCERARELVKQLLAFSRHPEQEAVPLEILPIIKQSLKLLRASIPANIEIRQNLKPRCGLVWADPTQISQIMMNLGSNAYHAMEEQGGVLEIGLEPVRLEADVALPDGPYVRLTVSDTGHGMDQQTLGRIFDPFFTTKPVGEGTGLGLSAIHGIIKSLGGAIKVSSAPGRGSTFLIHLPSYQSATPAEALPAEAGLRGTEHILLVDDEADIVRIGQEYLQRLGYRVTTWTSGAKAWEDFRAHPETYDLLITDLTMPKMNGIELAEAALHQRPDIPVILTTGFSETSILDRAKELGIRRCLMKPLVLRQLGWAVRRELDRKD